MLEQPATEKIWRGEGRSRDETRETIHIVEGREEGRGEESSRSEGREAVNMEEGLEKRGADLKAEKPFI